MFALRCIRLLLPLGCAVAAALPAAALPDGYTTRLWQTEDGLPQNSVTAIVQTRDGYLWVATYGGLARFDGVRFRTYDALNTPELRDARIVSLYEADDGALWIGHDSGLVTRYQAGRFETIDSVSVHAAERVAAISADAKGTIWILREGGSVESVDGRRIMEGPSRGAKPEVLALARSPDGQLYLDSDGSVLRADAGGLHALDLGPARHSGFVLGLGAARKTGVWLARDGGLERRDGERVVDRRGPFEWSDAVSVSTILEMRQGSLAVGTVSSGLYLFPQDKPPVHFDHRNGLPQDWVRALCEDREGNLWIGAGAGGLIEVVPTAFSVINPPDAWGGRTELALATDHTGALWIGTEGAGLYRYLGGEWSHFAQAEGLEHPFVWAVTEAKGGVLAGTWGGAIFRRQTGRFERLTEYDAEAGPVFALEYSARWHELWVATASGLIRWPDGGAPEPIADVGGPPTRFCAVLRDAEGTVWFGGPGTGLGRIKDNQVTRFHRGEGMPSDSVLCLHAAEDGALWIGTSFGGLARFKNGTFATIGLEQGLPNNIICHIADDGRGYFWLSTHRGLVRVAKTELDRCADGATRVIVAQTFDRNDGLPTVEFSAGLQGAGCATSDGRLWFPTSKGVVGVNPALIQPNLIPPPVILEAVQIDGELQERAPADQSEIRLRPDHERIEFQYTALSLTAPGKVAFKYRLDGIDQRWVEAGVKRTASYSRLPAGRYVFHVIASNNDGRWNERGAAVVCVVQPFFWQTWWFISLATAVMLAIVALAARHFTRRRLQRRLEELERRHAVERERARIARDIHDDIGATLTRITMLSQCLPLEPGDTRTATGVVEQIYDTAREATRALDEIVWAVNPRHDSLEGLVSYMGKFAQDYLTAAGVRCRLDVPVKLPGWPVTAEVRHHLFLAFKETLNNAVKHAGASEVSIGLKVDDRGFVLTVADNGAGFDPAAPGKPGADRMAGGNGLENIQRRLAAIGGTCELTTAPGRGTRVAFAVQRIRDKPAGAEDISTSASDP